MIAIIDYEVGNIRSVMCALRRINAEASLTREISELEAAEGIILPGVGAFSRAMEEIADKKLVNPLKELALGGKPLLGICLGHQLLFSESHEHGIHAGLGLIPGRVRRFGPGTKIPHMGWNQVKKRQGSGVFEGVEDNSFFYFAHSFCAEPADEKAVLAETDYGMLFPSAVQAGSIIGLQFHPEKSGEQGLKVLSNFCTLCRRSLQST